MNFLDEATYCTKYILNQILTREVCHVTPIDKWCGKKPLDDYKKKLDGKSHACIMMGYYEESKSYRLFDLVK